MNTFDVQNARLMEGLLTSIGDSALVKLAELTAGGLDAPWKVKKRILGMKPFAEK